MTMEDTHINCDVCGIKTIKTGPTQRYCPTCSDLIKAIRLRGQGNTSTPASRALLYKKVRSLRFSENDREPIRDRVGRKIDDRLKLRRNTPLGRQERPGELEAKEMSNSDLLEAVEDSSKIIALESHKIESYRIELVKRMFIANSKDADVYVSNPNNPWEIATADSQQQEATEEEDSEDLEPPRFHEFVPVPLSPEKMERVRRLFTKYRGKATRTSTEKTSNGKKGVVHEHKCTDSNGHQYRYHRYKTHNQAIGRTTACIRCGHENPYEEGGEQ